MLPGFPKGFDMKTSTLIGVAMTALVTFGFVQPTWANISDSGETLSRTVKYGDLNIQNEEGAKALLRRIRAASNYVCTGGWTDTSGVLHTSPSYRACMRQAQDEAVGKVNSPTVQALYNKRSSVRMASK